MPSAVRARPAETAAPRIVGFGGRHEAGGVAILFLPARFSRVAAPFREAAPTLRAVMRLTTVAAALKARHIAVDAPQTIAAPVPLLPFTPPALGRPVFLAAAQPVPPREIEFRVFLPV